MFRNLKLRTKLLAIALPPLLVLMIISAYAVMLSSRGGSSIDELSGDIRTLGLVCLAAVLLSALTMVLIGQSIVDPIDEIKRSALEVANERLPLLVEVLNKPGAVVPKFEPIVSDQHDELGELTDALNAIQDRVVEIAEAQQSVVQQGVSDLVINLARRNQSLLDRQLELIDHLEHDEQDPDRLEELFGLDHLATRMRRNAESLLVLAGAESTRRRGRPVQIADSIRVAMSEIENYQHVNLTDVAPTEISSTLALDLAHLLSELMENATQFSPPDRPVEVRGSAQPDGGYVVAVIDRGIGMSADQLTEANGTLARPPVLGLGMSRSLGFIVVGHLARRLGSSVALTPTPGGGTTATVLLTPAQLAGTVAQPPAPVIEPVTEAPVIEAQPMPPAPEAAAVADPLEMFRVSDHGQQVDQPAAAAQIADVPAFESRTFEPLAPELPASELPSFDTSALEEVYEAPAFEAPAPEVQDYDAPAFETPAPEVQDYDAPAFETPVNQAPVFEAPTFQPPVVPAQTDFPAKLSDAVPDGEAFDAGMEGLLHPATPGRTTATGLVKRDRTQSQAPIDEGRPVGPSTRSPEEIRSMLSRYREGLKGRPLTDIANDNQIQAQPPAHQSSNNDQQGDRA